MNKPPTSCVACESDNINCEGDQHEDELIFVYMNCRDCGSAWTEIYRFVSFTPENQPTQEGAN